ncbi:MAG TPA: hypothetical protein VJQ52_23190 [Steroidobacteraceae bacterium]|nr:hypothetical protein [Steroidobacteraceae bacterium]
MRHFLILIAAVLINTIGTSRLLASEAVTCMDCTVAVAIAKVSQEHDRAQSGLRAGDGDWLLSVAFDDRETYTDWRLRFGLALGFAEDLIRDSGMDATDDASWSIGLRFEFSGR